MMIAATNAITNPTTTSNPTDATGTASAPSKKKPDKLRAADAVDDVNSDGTIVNQGMFTNPASTDTLHDPRLTLAKTPEGLRTVPTIAAQELNPEPPAIQPAPVPEPTTFAILAIGALGYAAARWKSRP